MLSAFLIDTDPGHIAQMIARSASTLDTLATRTAEEHAADAWGPRRRVERAQVGAENHCAGYERAIAVRGRRAASAPRTRRGDARRCAAAPSWARRSPPRTSTTIAGGETCGRSPARGRPPRAGRRREPARGCRGGPWRAQPRRRRAPPQTALEQAGATGVYWVTFDRRAFAGTATPP